MCVLCVLLNVRFEMCKHMWESEIGCVSSYYSKNNNLRPISNKTAEYDFFLLLNSPKRHLQIPAFVQPAGQKPEDASFTLRNDKDKQQLLDIFT